MTLGVCDPERGALLRAPAAVPSDWYFQTGSYPDSGARSDAPHHLRNELKAGLGSKNIQPVKSSSSIRRSIRLFAAILFMTTLGWSPVNAQTSENTNQFLFLTLRLKDGAVTLKNARIVSGTLKRHSDSTAEKALLITLEQTGNEPRWKSTIDDPSIQRLEYEDPEQPGRLRSKQIQLDDTEFVVRAPVVPGVRQLAVHRKELRPDRAANKSIVTNSLLARIELPKAVTK